jgi:hypothetical protein
LGSPSSTRSARDSMVAVAPVRPRGWLSGAGLSNFGCGASPNPGGFCSTSAGFSSAARCSPSGWTSGREALPCEARLGFLGAGMPGIWGESRSRGRAERRDLVPEADDQFVSYLDSIRPTIAATMLSTTLVCLGEIARDGWPETKVAISSFMLLSMDDDHRFPPSS